MEQSLWPAALVTVLALLFVLRKFSTRATDDKPMEWPAGPRKLPIIGNLHQLAKGSDLVHQSLAKLAEGYGRVMTIWVGSWRPMIVVSDAELAWEVLVSKSPDYADRALPSVTRHLTANGSTVATSDAGTHWHTLRRGLQFGPLGPSNISAQAHFQEQDIELLIDSMKAAADRHGGVIKPFGYIRQATIRLLSRLCFGAQFADESFVDNMDRVVEENISITGHGRLVDAFAFARFIPSVRRNVAQTLALRQKIEQLIRPLLSQTPPPNSYLHFLLSQRMPEPVTIFSIFEVFLLGVDSTASTATWTLAFLIRHPDAQEKLHKEITEYLVEKQATVKVEDVGKLQYLQAVAKETMRMKPIAPLAVPHKTAKETRLGGRRVAKGTQVVVNVYAVHYDPGVWAEPHEFQPNRFLAGGKVGSGAGGEHLQLFLPFGGGMRACAGMELGKLQVALLLANLVRAFKWLPGAKGELPDLSEEMTFVLMMKNPLVAKIVPHVV